jgi:hypothetical protein
MMHAYDYDKQEWTEGPAAKKLRIDQIEAELALLTGPQGKEYAEFVGTNLEAAIKAATDLQYGYIMSLYNE